MSVKPFCFIVIRLGRVAADDVNLGGVKVPKGMIVSIPISSLHSDPEYWYDPSTYDPDR